MSMHEFEDLVEMSVRCLAESDTKESSELRNLFWNLYQFQEQWDTGFTHLRVLDILLKHKFVYRFELSEHPDYQAYKSHLDALNEFAFINLKPDQKWNATGNPTAGYYQAPYLYCDAGSPLWQRFVETGVLTGDDAVAPAEIDITELAKEVIVEAQKQENVALINMWYTAVCGYVVSFYSAEQQESLKTSPSLQAIRDIAQETRALKIDAGYGFLKQPTANQIKGDPYLVWWFQLGKRKLFSWSKK